MENQINSAINAIKLLRSSVSNVFETTLSAQNNSIQDESSFLLELQDQLSTVDVNFKSIESTINALNVPSGPFTLGNTAVLNHEADPDRQGVYTDLVNSYNWYEKTHLYSALANTMLSQNSLKRSFYTSSNKRRRPTVPVNPAQLVDHMINSINTNNMTIKVYRPFGTPTSAFLHVNLSRVMKAAIILRGLVIELVTVKGFNEPLDSVDDHWIESRYAVFRKIQDHAHCAMLHFYSPTFAELATRSFITWLASYSNIFSEPCKRCQRFLLNNLPPTYRDFRSLEPLHEECRH
ncbi:CLUMA_CG005920, isoform A [Clunio marinus]|uniref:CLUMA_CG005920, isoform A n=1 Tax=Clunio marinus TaxID=568069 RepID=A0A1J1HWA6_9DIPT|nr:CLUMA_CG005920, isoform A [Clunio marinus]